MAKIALDPGHGGEDSGAVGQHGLLEKTVNLAVAYLVKGYLEKAGHTVMMTRADDRWYGPDVAMDLNTRCSLINTWGADLAVSIHVNSGGGHYISTFIQALGGQAEQLASNIQAAMIRGVGWQDAGVKVENLVMNRKTNMKSCLVEMGFIDDPNQEAALGTAETQKTFAKAIAQGVIEHLGEGGQSGDWAAKHIAALQKRGIIEDSHTSGENITFGVLAAVIFNLLVFLGKASNSEVK